MFGVKSNDYENRGGRSNFTLRAEGKSKKPFQGLSLLVLKMCKENGTAVFVYEPEIDFTQSYLGQSSPHSNRSDAWRFWSE